MTKRKENPQVAGRPSKYNPEHHPKSAFKLALLGATDKEMASIYEVEEKTINNWKKEFPEFLQALKDGKDEADSKVAKSLYKRALGYDFEEITEERIYGDSFQKGRHDGKDYKLTEREWNLACVTFDQSCAYCGASKNTPDKEKFMLGDLTKDHVIALNKGGEYRRENVVPACGLCNSSKSDANMTDWYQAQAFFSLVRLQKIVNYLEFMEVATDQPAMTETKRVMKKQPPDVTACIFWLKNRKASKWREKTEVDANLVFNQLPVVTTEDGKELTFKVGDG